MKLFTLTLVFTGALLMSYGQTTLFTYGANWKYKDNGSNQGTAWRAPGFDDSAWSSGNGQLGYGDGDEATILNACGTVTQYPTCTNKYITSYYRKSFNIANTSTYTQYTINCYRDDGIVVYVNGTEVWRNNMPSTTITYTTAASAACSDDGNSVQTVTLPAASAGFVTGTNVIAVEIHQNAGSSSDLSFDMQLLAVSPPPGGALLTRGPYIQSLAQTSAILHWKTDVAVDTKVTYGTDSTNLNQQVVLAATTTDHIVQLNGLAPYTTYYYSIGSTTGIIQQSGENRFTTSPANGSEERYTFWVSGDCGTNTTHHKNVRDRFIEYMGGEPANGWLLLGDNAYDSGTESEYTTNFFDIYEDNIMKNTPLWPCPGNHDYANSSSRQNDHAVPYFSIFDLPQNGESGGVSSGNEAYYSYDYGNIHFLALDSYGKENNATRLYDTLGAQVQWIKADLAANTKEWVVAYWHHAPFTMGSHNSDTESELALIRSNFIRILEREGVDLILCGHSHDYERSKLMHGHYGNESSFNASTHNLSQSSGKYDGSPNSCTYLKDSLHNSMEGTVYVVSGSAGKLGGTQAGYPHNALPYSDASNGGSFILEFEANRLDAKWLCADGVIRDNFTIIKNSSKRDSITINYGDNVTLSASWVGNYSWSSNGATTRNNTVSPETSGWEVVQDQYQCVSDSVYITVIQPTVVLAALLANDYCVGSSFQLPYNVNGFFNNNNAFILELSDNSGSFASPTLLDTVSGNQNGTFQISIPENLAGGTYSLRITTLHPVVQSTILSGLNIHEIPAVQLSGLNPTYYANDPAITLSGIPAGGTFSGQGVSGNQFDPPAAGEGGPYSIIYDYTDAFGCSNSDTVAVIVNPIPPATDISSVNATQFCVGDPISVDYTIQGAFQAGNQYELQLSDENGSFASPTVLQTLTSVQAGTFNTTVPMSLVTGNNYQLRIVSTNPATSDIFATNIQISELPVAQISGLNASYFVNDNDVIFAGTPSGGTFSGPGVSGNTFSPATAGEGGPYNIIYSYTNAGGCTDSDTFAVIVNPIPPATDISSVNATQFCVGDPISVDYTIQGAFQAGNQYELQLSDENGSFASPTVLQTLTSIQAGTFSTTVPMSLVTGNNYQLRIVSTNPVTSDIFASNIQISELPVAQISGLNASYFVNDNDVIFAGTPAGGTFSGPGVNGNTFSPATAGEGGPYNIIYSYTNAGGCTDSDTFAVIVNPIPPATAISSVNATQFCVGDPISVDYTIQGAFQAGNQYELQLSDENGSFASPTVLQTLTSVQAGTFSTTVPMSLVTGNNYQLRIVSTTPVTSDIFATNIQISELPVAQISGLNASYFVNDNDVIFAGTPAGGTFSGPGVSGNTFSPATAGEGGPYNIIYSYTNAGGCTDSDTFAVIVNPIPPATDISNVNATQFCVGDPISVDYTIQGAFQAGNQYELQLSDENGSFASPTVLQTLTSVQAGTFSTTVPMSLVTGNNYQLRIVSTNPATSDIFASNIQISELPVAQISGLNASYFVNDNDVIFAGTPAGGTFSGPGVSGNTFSPATAGEGGPYNIIYSYTNAGGCTDNDTFAVIVNPIPPATDISNVNATQFCVGDPISVDYTIQGAFQAGNQYELQLSDANGSFASPTVLQTLTSVQAGTFSTTVPTSLVTGNNYQLRIVSTNPATSDIFATNIQISELPVVSFTGLNSYYTLSETPATLTGIPAGGTFSGPGMNGSVFSPAVAGVGGPYTIIYTYSDNNGCSNSDTLLTAVHSDPVNGLEEALAGGSLQVFPNPAKEVMNVLLELPENAVVEMELVTILGQIVPLQIQQQFNKGIHQISISAADLQLSRGVYYLRVTINGNSGALKICFE